MMSVNKYNTSVFDEYYRFRSLHIDSEEKVTRAFIDDPIIHSYIDPYSIVNGQCGRGNLWALGYANNKENNKMLETTMEKLRMKVEHCDGLSSIILFHTLGGGTGSGFGSRLMGEIRNEFKQFLIPVSIFPFSCMLINRKMGILHYNITIHVFHFIIFSNIQIRACYLKMTIYQS